MAISRFGEAFHISSGGSIAVDGNRATDLVFGMEQLHLVEAKRRWPEMEPGSIRLLDHPVGIADPYGRGLEAYESSAEHIHRAIDHLEL